MTFKEFMDLYDNWNGCTKINDDDLNEIVTGLTSWIMDHRYELFDRQLLGYRIAEHVMIKKYLKDFFCNFCMRIYPMKCS